MTHQDAVSAWTRCVSTDVPRVSPLPLSGVAFLADGVLMRCWSSPPYPPTPLSTYGGEGGRGLTLRYTGSADAPQRQILTSFPGRRKGRGVGDAGPGGCTLQKLYTREAACPPLAGGR